MASEGIVCTIPGKRKAQAVFECFDGDVVIPRKSSSVLKTRPRAHVYLGDGSTSLLNSA